MAKRRKIVKAALGLFLCASLVAGVTKFSEGERSHADEINSLSSDRLVVLTEDAEALSQEGRIISSGGGAVLVEYESVEEASRVMETLEAESIPAVYETYFSIAENVTGDVIRDVPPETENALDILDKALYTGVRSYDGNRVVAVVDTGANNASLLEKLSVLGDEGSDANGHGTRMIDAVRSTDPDAGIISIKALGENGAGSISSVYAAIMLAVEKGVKVINLSIVARAITENEIIRTAINEAVARNIIVVGAAGNSGADAAGYIPGCISEVMVVGAADAQGQRRAFSNYGSTVDWNVTADSTSEACALMSGFINENWEITSDLNSVISESVGQGLIWPVDYEPGETAGAEMDFNTDDWYCAAPEMYEDLRFEGFDPEKEKITGLKVSREGDLIELSIRQPVLPEDGSFVAAEQKGYAYIEVRNYYNGTGWMISNRCQAAGTVPDSVGDIVTAVLDVGVVLGLNLTYEPGALETNPKVAAIYGGEVAKPSDLVYRVFFSDGSKSELMVADGEHPAISPGSNQAIRKWNSYTTNPTLQHLYRIESWSHSKGKDMTWPVVTDTTITEENTIHYSEHEVGSARTVILGSETLTYNRIAVSLRTRGMQIYYQYGPEDEDLMLAETLMMGECYDAVIAENNAKKLLPPGAKEGWDYSALGLDGPPEDDTPLYPVLGTPVYGDPRKPMYKVIIKSLSLDAEREITYDMNDTEGSTRGVNPEENPDKYNKGESVIIADPQRRGYTFTGWSGTNLSGEGNKGIVIPEDSEDDISLVAHWTPIRYRVVFDGNGAAGIMQPITLSYDEEKSLPSSTFIYKGRQFLGYAREKEESTVSHLPGDGIKNLSENNDEEIKFYALWKKVPAGVKLRVMDDDNNRPVEGVQFMLSAREGTVLSSNLVTDGQGEITVEGLDWQDGGTGYIFTPVSVPEVYKEPEEVGFSVGPDNAGGMVECTALLGIRSAKLTLESSLSSPKGRINPIFIYRISGRDMAGTNHEYNLMSSFGELSVAGIASREIPLGTYAVRALPLKGYSVQDISGADSFELNSGIGEMIITGDREIRFSWNIDESVKRTGSSLKVNSLRK